MQPKDDIDKIIFNPRLREGGDEFEKLHFTKQIVFNPRLREGGDKSLATNYPVTNIFSIHASAKEATIMTV